MKPVERVRTAGRAFERLVAHLEQRREDGCDAFAVQHIQASADAERARRARARDLRPRPRGAVGDRPGDRHPHRPGHPRRHRAAHEPARPFAEEDSTARGLNEAGGGRPARSSEPPRRADGPCAGRTGPTRSVGADAPDHRHLRGLALPRLSAAQADRLGADRDLPRRRAVGPGEPAQRLHAARVRDHDRLPVPAADPDRDRRGDRPAAGRAGQQPDPEPAPVRDRRAGVRRQEPSSCASSRPTTTSPRSCRSRPSGCRRGSATPPTCSATSGSAS